MHNRKVQTEKVEALRESHARLCHELRALTELPVLQSLLSLTATQLSVADRAVHHDVELCDTALSEMTQRCEHTALVVAHAHLQHDLLNLIQAHQAVAGKFRGKMRDETEEVLARAVSGARSRLTAFEAVMANYTLPSKPYEIRRNALSVVSDQAAEVQRHFCQLIAQFTTGIAPDLVERLENCKAELSKFTSHLQKLRDQSSRKMNGNLDSCIEQFTAIVESVAAVELDAGLRGGLWFDDYGLRIDARHVAA